MYSTTVYINDTPYKTETTEKEATNIMYGLAGLNGIPNEDQYELINKGLAYVYNNSFESWRDAVNNGEVE
jgi:hypothetical protein